MDEDHSHSIGSYQRVINTPTEATTNNTSTFGQNVAIHFKKAVNAIAVDITGKYAALGGKKGVYILDLDEPQEAARTLSQQSKWEISVVEWNPHKDRSTYIASAANQDTLIWNIGESNFELQATLQTHQRAVSDLAWSLFDRNVLATCSADTYINLWDIRDPKKPVKKESFCGWTAGATQVKWNRKNPMTLASAHNGEVRVWDIRKVSNPMTFITAHMAKIYGIDWGYTDESELVTCSEDKQVKFWNVTNNRVCQGTLQSGVPILRARYTPFGKGLVTMAQRSDFTLRMWSMYDLNSPIKQFVGHNDVITSFDWRIRENNGAKEYQLVTWSKDQHLRLWTIDKSIQEACQQSSALPITSSQRNEESDARSISPIDRHSPSPYNIKNLQQELSTIEKRRPKDIIIEELSISDRYCVVGFTNKKNFRIRITFPSLYPNGAAPSFQILTPSALSTQNQAKIVEAMSETAAYHIEHNRPCLYQCLGQLSLLLKDMNEGDSPSAPLSPSNPVFGNSPYSASKTAAPPNDNIPCPRTSGAIFSVSGKLFYFNNLRFTRKRSNFAHQRLRTYRDLKAYLQAAPTSDFNSLHREESSSLFSNYFYSQQNYQVDSLGSFDIRTSSDAIDSIDSLSPPNSTYTLSLRTSGVISLYGNEEEDILEESHPSLPKNASSTSMMINNSVYIKDISYLMPLCYDLARDYTLLGSISDICRHNALAASAADRSDLVRVWGLIEHIMSPTVYSPDERDSLGKTPWAYHPMGRKLIMSMFKHYERLGDVQTLAIISCVLERVPQPVVEVKNKSNMGIHGAQFKSVKSSIIFTPKRKTILDPAFKDFYDRYRMYYADILYRWQLLEKRSEVLKHVRQAGYAQDLVKSALEFSCYCSRCGKALQDNKACSQCKIWAFSCSICHISVKGSANFCLVCGHGGHTAHMAEWFKTETLCPAGCGCNCITNFCGEGYEFIVKHNDNKKLESSDSLPRLYQSQLGNHIISRSATIH